MQKTFEISSGQADKPGDRGMKNQPNVIPAKGIMHQNIAKRFRDIHLSNCIYLTSAINNMTLVALKAEALVNTPPDRLSKFLRRILVFSSVPAVVFEDH